MSLKQLENKYTDQKIQKTKNTRKEKQPLSNIEITIAYINVHGLTPRVMESLDYYLNDSHALCMAETWFPTSLSYQLHPNFITESFIGPKSLNAVRPGNGLALFRNPNLQNIRIINKSVYHILVSIFEIKITFVYFPPSLALTKN